LKHRKLASNHVSFSYTCMDDDILKFAKNKYVSSFLKQKNVSSRET